MIAWGAATPVGRWLVRAGEGPEGGIDLPHALRSDDGRCRVHADAAGLSVLQSDRRLVVVDGSFDEQEERARALGLAPDVDAAAVALAAYAAGGARGLAGLEGAFALVLWDGETGRLLAFRDRSGTVPLLVTRLPGGAALSRSAAGLFACPAVSREPDPVRLATHMLGFGVSSTRTYFRWVRRLAPGTVWDLGDGRSDPVEVASASGLQKAVSGDDAPGAFADLLAASVARVQGRGRLAVFLSGGVDSGAVAAVAADVARASGIEPPLAFTLVFPGSAAAEEGPARELAAALGLEHVVLRVEAVMGVEPLSRALALTRARHVPPANPWSLAYDRLAELAAQRGCATIVSGELGDTVLSFRATDVAERLAAGDLRGLRDLFRARRAYSWRPLRWDVRWLAWDAGMKQLALSGARRLTRAVGMSDEARRLRLRRHCPSWALPDPQLRDAVFEETLEAGGTDGMASRLWPATLRDMAMQAYERTGALIVEPYADAALGSFLGGLGADERSWGTREKGLAHETIARRARPPAASSRSAYWVDDYLVAMLRSEGSRVFREIRGVPRLAELGLVRSEDVARRVGDSLVAGGRLGGLSHYDLWNVLSLEVWADEQLGQDSP